MFTSTILPLGRVRRPRRFGLAPFLIVLSVVVAMASAVSFVTPAQAQTRTPAPRSEGPKLPRVIPSHHPEEAETSTEAAASPASATIPLKWYGGPVQNYTKTYVIFWLPAGYTYERNGSNSNYERLIDRYFADVGGSTFANTQTQYYDSTNWVSNSSTFSDVVVDTTPYPVRNGSVYTTDSDIRAEVAKWIKARGWFYGPHEQFFVYTAASVLTWDQYLGWSNNGTSGYCAYHNYFSGSSYALQNSPIIYANMPGQDGHYPCYAKTFAGYNTAGQPLYNWFSPNGDYTADSAISTTSHEQFEAITDPQLNAWKDANGDENGDKCAYIYGTVASDTGNVTLNGHRYILQGEWSNSVFNSGYSGCVWYRSTPYH